MCLSLEISTRNPAISCQSSCATGCAGYTFTFNGLLVTKQYADLLWWTDGCVICLTLSGLMIVRRICWILS